MPLLPCRGWRRRHRTRRILVTLIATSVALQPLAAAAGTPYYRTKPIYGGPAEGLAPIQGPSPIRTHTRTLVDARYTVAGASNPQWSASGLPSGLSMSSSTVGHRGGVYQEGHHCDRHRGQVPDHLDTGYDATGNGYATTGTGTFTTSTFLPN